jgi:hypothetical protein
MEPRWNLDLRPICVTPQFLACLTNIEPSPKVPHLRRVSAKSCESVKADDGSRTRDLRLGKPTLYQLSYVRKCREMLATGRSPLWARAAVHRPFGTGEARIYVGSAGLGPVGPGPPR